LAASARFSSRRFLVVATIAALPARPSFRFGFDLATAAQAAFLDSAHLFRCDSAILARPAALILRRLRFAGSALGLSPANVVDAANLL
jgi:hypothetical protein